VGLRIYEFFKKLIPKNYAREITLKDNLLGKNGDQAGARWSRRLAIWL
jgi:hypothetical protein